MGRKSYLKHNQTGSASNSTSHDNSFSETNTASKNWVETVTDAARSVTKSITNSDSLTAAMLMASKTATDTATKLLLAPGNGTIAPGNSTDTGGHGGTNVNTILLAVGVAFVALGACAWASTACYRNRRNNAYNADLGQPMLPYPPQQTTWVQRRMQPDPYGHSLV